MQLDTTYKDTWSTPPSKITININYKDTLFEWANITPIRGESTFETLRTLRNDIIENVKSSTQILEEYHMAT